MTGVGRHDHYTRRLPVEDVKVPGAIERETRDHAELLPVLPGERADTIHLIEVGFEPAVVGREPDDLLGTPGGNCRETGQDRRARDDRRLAHSVHAFRQPPHDHHLHTEFVLFHERGHALRAERVRYLDRACRIAAVVLSVG